MTIALQQPLARLHAAWLAHLAVLAVLVLTALFSFRNAIAAAVHVWMVSPTYSHCFLIIPIVAWLVWERRHDLSVTTPRPIPILLVLLLPLLLVWWSGEILTINEVRQFSVIAIIQVLIVAVLGWAPSRILWFPILYLLFLVPTGEYLIVPMQHFAADFVSIGLKVIGVPFYREGTTFELTNGRFEIAEACAGLRFLIATTTLSVLVANMMFTKVYKWVFFLLASVIVPLIGNGLRCLGIILLAHYTNNALGAGADHLVYGWGFNAGIILVMIFIGYLVRDGAVERPAPVSSGSTEIQRAKLIWVFLTSFLLIGTFPALAGSRLRGQQPLPRLLTSSNNGAGWSNRADRGDTISASDWQPSFPGADATRNLIQTSRASDSAEFYVAYYTMPRAGHTSTAHVNAFWNERWALVSSRVAKIDLDDHAIKMQESILSTPQGMRMIWSGYYIDHQFATEPLLLKFLQLRAAIDGERGEAAIAVSTPISGTLESSRQTLIKAMTAAAPLIRQLSLSQTTLPQARGS